jgi:hypothetical protein
VSNICKDGRCCPSACNAPCQSCSSGSCVAWANADDNPECNGANTCDGGGACKKKIGQTCSAAGECVSNICKDGYCCGSACNAPCQTCGAGACAPVLNQDDSPECTGANTCDPSGACKLKSGQACVYATDCASGYCYCDKYTCVCQ